MATANENIRDAMIRHQIGLIRALGSLSKKIIEELRKSEKEIRKQIERCLSEIKGRGFDVGPTTTTRLLEIERQLRDLLGKIHRVIQEDTRKFIGEIAFREPVFVKNVIEDALPVIVNFGVPNTFVLREILSHPPVDGKILGDWLKKFEENDVERMMEEIRKGLVQGGSIPQITRRIFGTTRFNGQDSVRMISRRGAETLARTVSNGIANQARQAFFRQNASLIKSEVYTAILDNRTTVICASLDGHVFPPRPAMTSPSRTGSRSAPARLPP